jgi:hypothetical protein
MNKFKFKQGDIVRHVNETGWGVKLFQIETVYPSTCKEGHRYYGRDIDGKAFAAHETELYTSSEKEKLKWNAK